jgi:1,4-dihydroxy-2-naphthoate octaprenyltransferase
MMPVLGGYLVQVGDLTRTVYLASLPLVVATGLWVWIDELVSRVDDETTGRRTLVIDFGPHFAGRYGVLALAVVLFATVLLAVVSGSASPLALVTLLLGGLAWKIVAVCWTEHLSPTKMIHVRTNAFILHLVTSSTITASSLLTPLTS